MNVSSKKKNRSHGRWGVAGAMTTGLRGGQRGRGKGIFTVSVVMYKAIQLILLGIPVIFLGKERGSLIRNKSSI